MLSVRSTVARIPAVSRRLPRVAGANNAAVARTWYRPAARLAIRYRPAMSVYAVPTLPDAAETASTSAPICATPWMSRTTPLTVAAEAATIIPGASESVRAPSANPNRIQQRCTVRIPCASPAFSSKAGRNQLARQDALRRHPVIANHPRNRSP